MKYTKWTPEQKQFLRDNYPILGVKACAGQLGMPEAKVKSYVEYMGLKHQNLTDATLPKFLKCSKCGEKKDIKAFPRNGQQRRRDCTECRTIYRNKYNELNKKKVLATRKEWRNKNRHLILPKRRIEYATNPQSNIKAKLRARIRSVITRGRKSASTMGLLGCSLDYFLKYMQAKFAPGMNWEKFLNGEIHIDHKRPCASFDLTDAKQQSECFHYSNLQPLWAIDNLTKGDSVSP